MAATPGSLHGDFTNGSGKVGVVVAGAAGDTAGEVAVVLGTTAATASIDAAAKVVSVRLGIGDTDTEKMYLVKSGQLTLDLAGTTNVHGIRVLNHGGGSMAGIGVSYPSSVSAYMGRADGGIVTFGANNAGVMLYGNGGTAHVVSTLGAGASDIVVKVATQAAALHATARLMTWRTGMFGSESEKAYLTASSFYVPAVTALDGTGVSVNLGSTQLFSSVAGKTTETLTTTSGSWYTDGASSDSYSAFEFYAKSSGLTTSDGAYLLSINADVGAVKTPHLAVQANGRTALRRGNSAGTYTDWKTSSLELWNDSVTGVTPNGITVVPFTFGTAGSTPAKTTASLLHVDYAGGVSVRTKTGGNFTVFDGLNGATQLFYAGSTALTFYNDVVTMYPGGAANITSTLASLTPSLDLMSLDGIDGSCWVRFRNDSTGALAAVGASADGNMGLLADAGVTITAGGAQAAYFATGATTIAQAAWNALTPANSFSNLNTTTYHGLGYFKDVNGIVHLRGMLTRASAALNTNLSTAALPVGSRPAKNLVLLVSGNGRAAKLTIDSSGNLQVNAADDASWYSALSLENVHFDVRA